MGKRARAIEREIKRILVERRNLYQAGDIAGCDALADKEANLREDLEIAIHEEGGL